MKIFIQELHWEGCIVAIAETEEEAREVMNKCENYRHDRELLSYTIGSQPELIHVCYGDL